MHKTQLNSCFLFILAISIQSSFSQIPSVAKGTIIQHSGFWSSFVSERNIDVWLPEGYQRDSNYPVLYMHDGQMLFDSSFNWNKQEWKVDEIMTALIEEKKISPCIVVGIWNTADRHPEYCPQKPFEALPYEYRDSLIQYAKRNNGNKQFSGNIKSDAYLKFIVTELKPFIDRTYSTKTDKAHTFMMGSSMGGLISLYAITEYPEIFGGIAGLSTHWTLLFSNNHNLFPQAMLTYLENKLSGTGEIKIYADQGDQGIDSLYRKHQLHFDGLLSQTGNRHIIYRSAFFPGSNHTEKDWSDRLHQPLIFLLGKEKN